MAYDADTGFMTSRTAAGILSTFAADGHGNVGTRTVINAQNSGLTQPTTFDHDRGVLSGTHTLLSDVTMVINEDGTVHTQTQVGRTTQGARTTSFEYDVFGRITKVHYPLGDALSHPTLTAYAPDHTWVQVSRGTAFTRTCADGFGRTKATIVTAGQRNGADLFTRTDVEYDALGRVAFSSLPYETTAEDCPLPTERKPGTTFEYDATGRMTRRTNADATYATMEYAPPDTASLLVKTTDERGQFTTQVFEASGSPSNARLHTFTDAAGQVTTYGYDAPGNLVTVTSPTQATTPTSVTRQWFYDAYNRLDHQVQPESGTVTYQYDGFGRLWHQTDALGHVSTYTYDDENRLTDIATLPNVAPWFHAEFDEWGDRVLATNVNAKSSLDVEVTSRFHYDADHRLEWRTDTLNSRTFKSSYEYDANDRVTGVSYPSGNHVNYTYPHDQLSVVYDADPDHPFAKDFAFHPSGGLASYTTGNGVVHTTTYDARDRIDHIGSRKTTDDDVLGLTYGYDAVGNVTSIQDHVATKNATFGYDALNRLETASQPGTGGWGSLAWAYDFISNRTSQTKNGVATTYAYTTANRLDQTTTGSQTESFQYNAAGLMTSDARGGYQYAPNNLQKDADLISGATYYYLYDADGQRIWKSKGDDEASTYYLHGPFGVLSEFEGAGGSAGWSVDYIYAAGRLIATTKPPTGEWHTLTGTHHGGAGRVTSAPSGLDCDLTCTERFTRLSDVTLTAAPSTGQTFSGWSGACSGQSLTTTVTITGDLTCGAWFSTNPQLALTKAGSGAGTMATDPAGLSCETTCTTGLTPGASLTLTATPATGSRFAGWSGDADCADGAVTLGASVSCTATFVALPPPGCGWRAGLKACCDRCFSAGSSRPSQGCGSGTSAADQR